MLNAVVLSLARCLGCPCPLLVPGSREGAWPCQSVASPRTRAESCSFGAKNMQGAQGGIWGQGQGCHQGTLRAPSPLGAQPQCSRWTEPSPGPLAAPSSEFWRPLVTGVPPGGHPAWGAHCPGSPHPPSPPPRCDPQPRGPRGAGRGRLSAGGGWLGRPGRNF